MQIRPLLEPIEHGIANPVYLARIWHPPTSRGSGWSTSDWLLTDTDSVKSVIDWAHEEAHSNTYQILVQSDDGSFILIHGEPPEESIERVEIVFRE